jgi:hypothetical protein
MPNTEYSYLVRIRHWLPIITFCPVNHLPDFVYVEVVFEDEFVELYQLRKDVRKLLSGRKEYMENLAVAVAEEFPAATEVTIRLLFNRHVVTVRRPF